MIDRMQSIEPEDGSIYNLSVWIDTVPVPNNNIANLTIREYVFTSVPTIELDIIDDGAFIDYNPINAGSVIRVELGLNDAEDYIIEVDFKVTSSDSITTANATNRNYITSITGYLDVGSYMNGIKSKSFSDSTFSSVVTNIAKDNELKSNISIESTDAMNWYMLNQTPADFINTHIHKSYIADDIPFCFIDRKKTMNYSSLKAATSKNVKPYTMQNDVNKKITSDDVNSSVKYFSSFSISDSSEFNNVLNGSNGTNYSYYNGDELVTKQSNEDIDAGLVSVFNKLPDSPTTCYKSFGQQSGTHKNYFKAMVDNVRNRQSLLSSSLVINSKAFDHNLMDVINIEISSGLNRSNLIERYSGKYVIGGIVHTVARGTTYNQMLICYRNGFNKVTSFDKNKEKLKKVK